MKSDSGYHDQNYINGFSIGSLSRLITRSLYAAFLLVPALNADSRSNRAIILVGTYWRCQQVEYLASDVYYHSSLYTCKQHSFWRLVCGAWSSGYWLMVSKAVADGLVGQVLAEPVSECDKNIFYDMFMWAIKNHVWRVYVLGSNENNLPSYSM